MNVQHMTLVCQISQFLLLCNSEAKHTHFITFSLYFMWLQKCDFTSPTSSKCDLAWHAFRLINMQVMCDSRTNFCFNVIQSNRLFVWWICLAVKLLSLNNTAIHLDCLQYCLNNNTTYFNQSIVLNIKLNIK